MKIRYLKERFRDVGFKQMVTYNFWLKLISLGMAVIIWLYVRGVLTSGIKV